MCFDFVSRFVYQKLFDMICVPKELSLNILCLLVEGESSYCAKWGTLKVDLGEVLKNVLSSLWLEVEEFIRVKTLNLITFSFNSIGETPDRMPMGSEQEASARSHSLKSRDDVFCDF